MTKKKNTKVNPPAIHGGIVGFVQQQRNKKVYTEHDKDVAVQLAKEEAANDYTRMEALQAELVNINSSITNLKRETEDHLKFQARIRAELKEVTDRINDATFKAMLP